MFLVLEPKAGIEPATYSLRVNCSTPEPLWRAIKIYLFGSCVSSERKASKRDKNDIIDLSEEKLVKALKFFKKAVSVILCLSLSGALFTGCKKSDDLFPSIISDSEETSSPDETDQPSDTNEGNEIRQLEVALPYSDLTIQYLAALLYCKNNGLWDSSDRAQ